MARLYCFLTENDSCKLCFEIFLPHFSKPIQLFPILADSFVVELLAVELFNC